MKRSACLAALIGCVLSASSFAQEPPKPGPEHAMLKELEGTWDAVMTMAGAPKDAPASKGTQIYKMECGGLWLSSKFEGDFAGMKFEGRGIDGYDQAKKKYIAIWVDSMSGAPLLMEGTRDEKTKVLTLMGDHPGPDGKPAKFMTKSLSRDKNHHTFTMYLIGEDKKELEMMTIEYTRKK